MIKKILLSFFLLGCSHKFVYTKEIILDAFSQVKQTKFMLKAGAVVFVEKYQNVNGKITENFSVNDVAVLKDEFLKRFLNAQEEEKALQKEVEENKKREEEKMKEELELQKKREEEQARTSTQIQALKKLINIELDKVQTSFLNLDKYKIDEYFVFEQETFSNLQVLQDNRINLINQAKEFTMRSEEHLKVEELKEILKKLEVLPDKVERFIRNSVKFAINQCNDTKKLKELLTLV